MITVVTNYLLLVIVCVLVRRCPKVNKKLVSKLCEEIYTLLTDTK